MKAGSVIALAGLFALFVYLIQPVDMLFEQPLSYANYPTSFASCTVKKVPYNCISTIECDKVCKLKIPVIGTCLKWEKTNCHKVEKCQYKNEVKCDSKKAPYYPTPPSSQPKCEAGQIYTNGKCEDYFNGVEHDPPSDSGYSSSTSSSSSYKPVIHTYTTTRLMCGGDVIENKYIRGFRYLYEQKVKVTCIDGRCTSKPIDKEIKEDCVRDYPFPHVCRDDIYPRCVVYPLEVKVHILLGKIGIIK